MSTSRTFHRLVVLPDGRVLIAGGFSAGAPTASVDLFDPASDTITAAGDMGIARSDGALTLLPDGRVLYTGGFIGGNAITNTAEIYDPDSDSWTATGDMIESREAHTSVLLDDGTVLIAAGQGPFPAVRSSTEIYDPATGTFSARGAMGTGRFFHTSTKLANGSVLVAGGSDNFNTGAPITSVEVYDPALGVWASPPPLAAARLNHTATLLADGSILFFGGDAAAGGSVERYELALVSAQAVDVADPVVGARDSHSATTLTDGSVLIAGGDTTGGGRLAAAEIFALDEASVEPPPEVPPGEEEPLAEPPSFADLADTPLDGLTFIVYELPPGLSLVSLTGIIPLLAALQEAELSAAASHTVDGDRFVPPEKTDDLNNAASVRLTKELVDEFTIGVVNSIFDPNTRKSWSAGLPPALNSLVRLLSGAYWFNAGPDGAFVIDLYWPGTQTVDAPGSGFHAVPYTGPSIGDLRAHFLKFEGRTGGDEPRPEGDPSEDGNRAFEEIPDGTSIFRWLAGDWRSYTRGAPAFVQSLTQLGYGEALIARFDDPISFLLPAAELLFGDCAILFTLDGPILNPGVPGAQDALDLLDDLSGGEFGINGVFSPETSLAAFNGEDANGTWCLEFTEGLVVPLTQSPGFPVDF